MTRGRIAHSMIKNPKILTDDDISYAWEIYFDNPFQISVDERWRLKKKYKKLIREVIHMLLPKPD